MTLGKYVLVARNEGRTALAYRGAVSALWLSATVLIGLQFFLWQGVFDDRSTSHGVGLNQVLAYAVAARLWVILLPGFRLVKDFETRGRDGSIVRDLLYPAAFLGIWFARAAGRSLIWAALVALPLLIIALVAIRPELDLAGVALALVGAAVGYVIAFCLATLVGLGSLFLRRTAGLNELRDALIAVLGGSLLPLTFYPDTAETVLRFLPFVYVYYVPIGLFSGLPGIGGADVAIGGAWAVLLTATLVFATARCRTRLVIDGG